MILLAPLLLATQVAAAQSQAPAHAWPLLEQAAAVVSDLPTTPLVKHVRELRRDAPPVLDEDMTASLDAARAAQAAAQHLDAAQVAKRCALPPSWSAARMTALGEHTLANALIDGAEGKKSRAATNVVRVADLAALLLRCDGQSTHSWEAASSLDKRARDAAWYLAEQRHIDATGLARIAAALGPTSKMERAKEQAELLAAATPEAFEKIARTNHRVVVACSAGKKAGEYTVTRAVAAVLERRAQEIFANDSVVVPDLSGAPGLILVSAGPVARSCGFRDQDVLLAVNGLELRRMEQAIVDVPAQVVRDRRALFVVRRAGELTEWSVGVDEAAK